VELVIDLRQTLITTEATSRIWRATELLHSQTVKYYPIHIQYEEAPKCLSFLHLARKSDRCGFMRDNLVEIKQNIRHCNTPRTLKMRFAAPQSLIRLGEKASSKIQEEV
jgi:hypothetical protein